MAHDRDSATSAGAPAGLTGRDLIGLGGVLVGAVVVGTIIGLLVDHAAGTAPVFVLVGIGIGILFAVVGFIVKVRAALSG